MPIGTRAPRLRPSSLLSNFAIAPRYAFSLHLSWTRSFLLLFFFFSFFRFVPSSFFILRSFRSYSFIRSFIHISVYLLYIHLFVCLFIYLFTFFCFPLSPKNHCEASVAFSPTRHRVAANSLRVHLRLFRVYSRKNVQERNVTSGKEIASENAAETSAQSLGSGPRRNVHAHR